MRRKLKRNYQGSRYEVLAKSKSLPISEVVKNEEDKWSLILPIPGTSSSLLIQVNCDLDDGIDSVAQVIISEFELIGGDNDKGIAATAATNTTSPDDSFSNLKMALEQ